jgi:predicted phosphodiesterase
MIAILSDIHSNWPALIAVLRDLPPGVEQIWCLGDVVNYYAYPQQCIDTLRNDPRCVAACWVLGNHDAAVVGLADPSRLNCYGQATLAYTRGQLTLIEQTFIRERPCRVDRAIGGTTITLAHASPADPLWSYVRTAEDAQRAGAATPARIVFVGHTHVAQVFVERTDSWERLAAECLPRATLALDAQRLIVNVGSVGQPRDGDPRAAYTLFDPARGLVMFRRCRYPIALAQHAIWREIVGSAAPRAAGELMQRLQSGA